MTEWIHIEVVKKLYAMNLPGLCFHENHQWVARDIVLSQIILKAVMIYCYGPKKYNPVLECLSEDMSDQVRKVFTLPDQDSKQWKEAMQHLQTMPDDSVAVCDNWSTNLLDHVTIIASYS